MPNWRQPVSGDALPRSLRSSSRVLMHGRDEAQNAGHASSTMASHVQVLIGRVIETCSEPHRQPA